MEQHERQTAEQNLASLSVQKQALQQQLMETELALKELSGAKTAYKIVSSIMISTPVETLKQELEKKRDTAQTRLSLIETQEAKLSAKLQHG